jgi:hypothetical protein
MASVLSFFDGSWFDAASFAVAVAYAYWKSLRAPVKQKFISKSTAMDVANGTSLFPLFALSLSLFSSKLLEEIIHSNKLILSVAGLCALLALLEDDFKG